MSLPGRCPLVSLDAADQDNGEMAYRLEADYGILTRCGLHCAPLAHRNLGTFPRGAVRFSFGHWNTEEEVETAARAVTELTG